jgi:hypothetical protein
MPVHELCHYIPAKIMGLNPSFDMFKGKFRVQTHDINDRQVLIVGLMPIPFVAIVIFMALYFMVDYSSIVNNKSLCLLIMIILSIIGSFLASGKDIELILHVFN